MCFSARVLVIALNAFLGHWGTGPNTDVFLLFVALDSWIPVWIPGSALLYLMRQTPEQRFRGSRPSQTRYAGGDTGGWKRPQSMDGTNDDDDMDDFSNDSGLGRSSVSDIVHNGINQLMTMNFEDQIIVRRWHYNSAKGLMKTMLTLKAGTGVQQISIYVMFFVGVYETNCYNYYIIYMKSMRHIRFI